MLRLGNPQEYLFHPANRKGTLQGTVERSSSKRDCKTEVSCPDRNILFLQQILSYFLHKPGTYPSFYPLTAFLQELCLFITIWFLKAFPFFFFHSKDLRKNIVTFSSIKKASFEQKD